MWETDLLGQLKLIRQIFKHFQVPKYAQNLETFQNLLSDDDHKKSD